MKVGLGLKTSLRTTEIFYQGALNQGASSFNSYFSSVNKKLGLFSKDYASTLDKNLDTQILVNNLGEGEETYINSYIGTAATSHSKLSARRVNDF